MNLLERTNRVVDALSTAPLFDWQLGIELSERAQGHEGYPALVQLSANGVVEPIRNLFRVVEPLRQQRLDRLRDIGSPSYASNLQVVSTAFSSSMSASLGGLLGPTAVATLVLLFRTLASSSDQEFRHLDEHLSEGASLNIGRERGVVSSIYTRYARRSEQRRAVYLSAMSDWVSGRRDAATFKFDDLLAADVGDRIAGVSGHLRGVAYQKQNRSDDALSTLLEACDVLEENSDWGGNILTRASAARVALEAYRATRRTSYFAMASNSIDLATALLRRLPAAELGLLADTARRAVAEVEVNIGLEVGDTVFASRILAEAVDDNSGGRLEHLRRAILRARVERNAAEDGSDLRRIGSRLRAEIRSLGKVEDGTLKRQVAIAYNVLSSIERDINVEGAIEAAQLSIRLGEAIGDSRHVAHATNSLLLAHVRAIELGEFLLDESEWMELKRLGGVARSVLKGAGDFAGAARVESSIASLQRWFVRVEQAGLEEEVEAEVESNDIF